MIKSFYIKKLFFREDILLEFEGKNKDESRYMIGPNGNGKTTILNLLFQTIVIQDEPITNTAYKFNYTKIVLEENKINLDEIYLYRIDASTCGQVYKFESKLILKLDHSISDRTETFIFERIIADLSNNYIESLMELITKYIKKNDFSGLSEDFIDYLLYEENYKESPDGVQLEEFRKYFVNITDEFEGEYDYRSENSFSLYLFKQHFQLDKLEKSILYFPTYRQIGDIINNLNNHSFSYEDLDEEKRKVISINQENLNIVFDKVKNNLENINSTGLTNLMRKFIEQSLSTTYQTSQLATINNEDIKKVKNLAKKLNIDESKIMNFENDYLKEENKNNFRNLASLNDLFTDYLKNLDEKIKPIKILKSSFKAFFGDKIKLEFNEKNFEISLSKNLDQLSSGQKQLIGIVTFSLLEMNNSIFKKPLILIDEPELSLHIDWQRNLNHYLSAFKNNQYFVATHSPFFLRDTDISLILEVNGDED